ncbi:MAG: glycosyltransferase family 2 protein [Patescibacteria group bacterium]
MRYGTNRVVEILPGALTWTTLIAVVTLSFVKPVWVIVFVILFDLYWLIRVLYFVTWLFVSWMRYRQEVKISWLDKLKTIPLWHDLWHIVFLPTYKDTEEVLETTFRALDESNYPHDRIIIVLAGEERDQERFEHISQSIIHRYENRFAQIITTLHPSDLPDEIPGKGSNLYWAGKRTQEFIDAKQIPYDRIVVSAFDIDTVVHPQYFARLSYAFLTHPTPLRTSYQPLALFNNNIWDTPSFSRVVANSTTFWLMTELARPERLLTFSSHAMPWQALVDVGFWQKDIVNEDARISMQCLVHYHGDYRVTPLYIPVSMDTCYGGSVLKTITNQYKQMRRWAWSVEHLPYLVSSFKNDSLTPLRIKFKYIWIIGEGTYSWATAAMLITLSRLPLWVAAHVSSTSLLVQNAPFVLEWLMRLAMLGIAVSAFVSVSMLPPAPRHKTYKILTMVAQWFLLPITLLVFGSIPAIDAQTRLMFGKYLGFWSTEKVRTKNRVPHVS